jgi:hypothetical protein
MRDTGTRSRIAAAAALLFCLTVSACSAPPAAVSGSDGQESSGKAALFEAKRLALDVQEDIISFVPSENVADLERTTKSALLGCGDDYLWPGGARIGLQGEFDPLVIIDSISGHFQTEGEWTLGDSPTASATGLSLAHDDGRKLSVVFSADSAKITITSFSSCFAFEPAAGTKY